jgi:hypothetical protein
MRDIVASTAACPNVSDVANAPSCGTGCTPKAGDLGQIKTKIFFRAGLDNEAKSPTL